MNSKPELLIAPCSYEAAKYACLNWHYAACVPCTKRAMLGVWERGSFRGAVIFSPGTNCHAPQEFSISFAEYCELTRVALTSHVTPVSKIVAICISVLRKTSPGLRLIASYANPEAGHVGSIYQAMNWLYIGMSDKQSDYMFYGKRIHKKTLNERLGRGHGITKYAPPSWKHKYLYPLDNAMREQLAPLAKPYPKKCAAGEAVSRPASQPEEGGSIPTAALHSSLEVPANA